MSKYHPKCRPPRGAAHVDQVSGARHKPPLKLFDNGRWKADDGEPGLAFIGVLDGEDRIWVAPCKCRDAGCPRWSAMTHARERLDLAAVSVCERPRVKA